MTRIAIEEENGLKITRVNGKMVAVEGRVSEVAKVGLGRWAGMASGEPFELIGGKESGGAANEWFVRWAPGYGEVLVPAKSAKHAIELIESC